MKGKSEVVSQVAERNAWMGFTTETGFIFSLSCVSLRRLRGFVIILEKQSRQGPSVILSFHNIFFWSRLLFSKSFVFSNLLDALNDLVAVTTGPKAQKRIGLGPVLPSWPKGPKPYDIFLGDRRLDLRPPQWTVKPRRLNL